MIDCLIGTSSLVFLVSDFAVSASCGCGSELWLWLVSWTPGVTDGSGPGCIIINFFLYPVSGHWIANAEDWITNAYIAHKRWIFDSISLDSGRALYGWDISRR